MNTGQKMASMKMQLVALAEFMQTTLTDAQILLYSHDLFDMGPFDLAKAIAILKRDPDLWSGRFPLPGKLRAYLSGTAEQRAIDSARRIMECSKPAEIYALQDHEKTVALAYGVDGIVSRHAGSSPTIFAQLRDMLKSIYIDSDREETLAAIEDKNVRTPIEETPVLEALPQAANISDGKEAIVEGGPAGASPAHGAGARVSAGNRGGARGATRRGASK